MNIIDAHCDTLYEITFSGHEINNNKLHIDLERLGEYPSYTQIFAAWLENEENASEKFLKMSEMFDKITDTNPDKIKKCLMLSDLTYARENGQIGAFLALEGAYNVKRKEDIDFLYKKGVRFITLTWNFENKIAGGVESESGLSEFGKEVIKRCEELGIVVDVSHLNEKSFYDVIRVSKNPIIASHSNSKTLCNHVRNLTDDQFLKICENGGVVGINFYSDFLKENGASLNDIISHIRHFILLGGEDNIGFGSDFDGVERLPKEVYGAESIKNIVDALKKSGISDEVIEKITHKNFERIIKNVVG